MSSKYAHVVFDSYCEFPVKEGERVRRAAYSGGTIDVVDISVSVPIPQQIEKFWTSTPNKEGLRILARDMLSGT